MSFFLPRFLSAQGFLIGSGAQLVANGAAKLVLNDGSFTNNGTFTPGGSTVSFTGSGSSSTAIGGSSALNFNNIIINRTTSDVALQQAIAIAGNITMTSHNLVLGNYVADLGTTGTVLNENANSKILSSIGTLNVSANLNAPNAANPGNLGLEITSSANLGATLIKRYNTSLAVSGLDNSISRYYTITPTNNTTLDATITFHYLDSELGLLSESDLNVWSSINSGTTWNFYGNTASDMTANTVTTNHLNVLSQVTLSSNNINAPLALKLLSFSAVQSGKNALLNWITSQEQNNDRFEIERSSDGASFSSIGSVLSKGDNNNQQAYSYIDNTPGNNLIYYRLKMVDKDQSYEYSNIVLVRMNVAFIPAVSVYPVPVKSTASVKVITATAMTSAIQLLDASGNIVYTTNWQLSKGTNIMQIPMEHLASGTYYLNIGGLNAITVSIYKN